MPVLASSCETELVLFVSQFRCRTHNTKKLVALQARATNERSIDIRLRKQFAGILGFHAAAVLNSESIAARVIELRADPIANKCMSGFSLFRRGRDTRTDRPHRLVC